MKRLRYLCLCLALGSTAGWAATGTTSEDTAPATPGVGSPPAADTPGASKGNAPVTDPTRANGALDLREVDKKSAGAATPRKTHPQEKDRTTHEQHGTHRQSDAPRQGATPPGQ